MRTAIKINGSLLGVLTLLAFGPSAAKANNLDRELLRKVPEVVKYLQSNGYENVGVLKFRLQRGASRPVYRSTLINQSLADRFENAIILAMDSRSPFNVITNASQTAAAAAPTADYRTASGRKELFKVRYRVPLKVKNPHVLADAFVTGKVVTTPDCKELIVSVEVFDRKSPETVKRILQFKVASDRSMLADLGRGFSLSRISFARGGSVNDVFEELDDFEGIESLTELEEDLDISPSDVTAGFPVKLRILYDGAAQHLDVSPELGAANYVVKDPKEGQKVQFEVENTTSKPLAIVLTVNGINTLYREEGDAYQMSRWILQPNRTYRIRGFYDRSHREFNEIVGLSEEESKDKLETLGELAGLIHLYVYQEADGDNASTPLVSTSLNPPQAYTTSASSWSEYQGGLAKSMKASKPKGLMFANDQVQSVELKTGELENVIQTDVMIIQYYSAKDQ